MSAPDLLRVRDLTVDFFTPAGKLRAVDGLDFRLRHGSSVALVGESGSGKSVTAQAILGILPRVGRISRGEILLTDASAPAEVLHPGLLSFLHDSLSICQRAAVSVADADCVGPRSGAGARRRVHSLTFRANAHRRPPRAWRRTGFSATNSSAAAAR